MADDKTFLTELRALMQRIPADMTAEQLKSALKETSMALNGKLTGIQAGQHQANFVPSAGPRK